MVISGHSHRPLRSLSDFPHIPHKKRTCGPDLSHRAWVARPESAKGVLRQSSGYDSLFPIVAPCREVPALAMIGMYPSFHSKGGVLFRPSDSAAGTVDAVLDGLVGQPVEVD